MFKRNWLQILIMLVILASSAFGMGGQPSFEGTGGSPEPVSTAFIGTALVTLYQKLKKGN